MQAYGKRKPNCGGLRFESTASYSITHTSSKEVQVVIRVELSHLFESCRVGSLLTAVRHSKCGFRSTINKRESYRYFHLLLKSIGGDEAMGHFDSSRLRATVP